MCVAVIFIIFIWNRVQDCDIFHFEKRKKNKWNEKSERTNKRNKWCTLHIIYMLWYDTIYIHSLAFCLSFTHGAVLPSMPKLSAPPFYIFASVCVHMYIHFKAFAFGWCVRNRECVFEVRYAMLLLLLCSVLRITSQQASDTFFPVVCRLFSVQYTQNWMWLD